MDPTPLECAGGVRVSRTATAFDGALLTEMTQRVEARRGGVLSSGMEYPGRYSRWHMAYVDPCVELVARGRRVTATALNDRGQVLLPVIGDAMRRVGEPVAGAREAAAVAGAREPAAVAGAPVGSGRVEVVIPEAGGPFAGGERSRRPTLFSALREIIAAFSGPDPPLGLYRAVGHRPALPFQP